MYLPHPATRQLKIKIGLLLCLILLGLVAVCQCWVLHPRHVERMPVTPSLRSRAGSERSLRVWLAGRRDPSLRGGVTARTPLKPAHGKPSLQMSGSCIMELYVCWCYGRMSVRIFGIERQDRLCTGI
jgi:hypothetical protein